MVGTTKLIPEQIPTIALYVVEVVRRYPSTVPMFEELFQEQLKSIAPRPSPIDVSSIRNIILLFCELCLCGVIAKENTVGKMIKILEENIKQNQVGFLSMTFSRLQMNLFVIYSIAFYNSTALSTWGSFLPSYLPRN